MGITRFGLKRPVSVIMVVLAVLIFGISSLFGIPAELLPEMETPVFMVRTAYEGADPETIDETVSRLIEKTAETLNGVESIQSYSYEDYSVVVLRYQYDADRAENFRKLQNALAEIKENLPQEAGEPVILEMDMEAEMDLQILAHAEDEKEILAFLGEGMLAELENLPSVAKVEVYGGAQNYVSISLKENLLNQYGLDMDAVAEYIAAADFAVPVGSVTQGRQNLHVTSSAGSETLQEIKNIPLQGKDGGLLRLEDIADIFWTEEDSDSISRFNGEKNVTLNVTKNQRFSTAKVSEDVKELLQNYERQNHEVRFELFYDSGEEVLSSVKTIGLTLCLGMLLAMIVVYLFFGSVKTCLVTGAAVLISLAAVMTGMEIAGLSFNTVTIAALIITAGLITDTAVTVLESCFRIKGACISQKEAAVEGAGAVGRSLIASALTTLAVCVPIVFLKGFSAQLFEPLGWIVVLGTVASLLTALTVIPLFFVMWKPEEKENKFHDFLENMEERYEELVRKLLKRKDIVMAASIFLFAVSCAAVIYTNTELLPQNDNGTVNVTMQFRSGAQNAKIEEKILILEDLIDNYLEVDDYTVIADGHEARFVIKLKKGSKMSYEKFGEDLKEKTKDYAGIDISVSGGSETAKYGEYEGEQFLLSGYELEDVKNAAQELAERFRNIPGALAVFSSSETEATKLEIKIDPLRAMEHGMTSAEVAKTLRKMVNGQDVMTLSEESRDYTVRLEFAEGVYTTPQNLMNVSLQAPDGTMVLLSEIAELEYTDAQECIVRHDGKYIVTLTVTCLEKYRDHVTSDMNKEWKKMEASTVVTKEENDVERMMQEEFPALFKAIAAAVFLIFAVLTILFESPKYALMVMLSIPLGLFGAFLLVFITGSSWNLPGIIGVLLLAGIVVNHGIRYVETADLLSKTMDLETALIESGKLRFRPILMVAMILIAILLPMAVWPGQGVVMMRETAIVIIGGIISAASLILLVFPVFYLFMYGKTEEDEEAEEEEKIAKWSEINGLD